MRFGLFWKLFLFQVLAAAAVLAGALAFSRTFSVHGFAEYLETRERVRVQEVAAQIAHNYHGDLLAASEGLIRDRRHRPPGGEASGFRGRPPESPGGEPPPLPRDDAPDEARRARHEDLLAGETHGMTSAPRRIRASATRDE